MFSAKQARWNQIKSAIRNKYAWPGGYPLYIIMRNSDAISIDAARDNYRLICSAHVRNDVNNSWFPLCADINYEDDHLYCSHSGEKIESAYCGEEE